MALLFDFPLQPPHTLALDFTAENPDLRQFDISNQLLLQQYIDEKLAAAGAKAGIGGYGEHRILYRDKKLFGTERFIHLGIDIWLPAGTPIHAPAKGRVHSFAYNEGRGNYGATLIVEHEFAGETLYALYGHLSLDSLDHKKEGQAIAEGEKLAYIGIPAENGGWATHLHFQLIRDLRGCKGDFIGVTSLENKQIDLDNCPNPMNYEL